MDPLSLTASIVAVLGVVNQVAKGTAKLASLRGAPEAVLGLHNEAAHLQMIILAIQDVFEKQKASGVSRSDQRVAPSNVDSSVINSLDQANVTLSNLYALCKRLKISTPESIKAVTFERVTWVKEQKKVKKIRKDLKKVTIQLMTALGALNAYVGCLHFQCIQPLASANGRWDRSLSLRYETHARIEHQNQRKRIEELEVNQTHTLMKAEANIQSLHEKMYHAQASQPRRQDHLQFRVNITDAEEITSIMSPDHPKTSRGCRGSLNVQESFENGQSIRRVSMRASQLRCMKECSCICHLRRTYRSPPILDRFFGVLSVGCAGIPRVTPPCDSTECAQRSSPTVLISFFFPSWLLTRALIVLGRFTPMHGPEMIIRLPRVVGDNALIFDRCAQNDIRAVRELLRQGLASISDVRCTTGETPLHVSFYSAIILVALRRY